MRLESISLRTLIVSMLTLIVTISVLHTLVSKDQFRDAAIAFRIKSVSRLTEVAKQEMLQQARGKAISMGSILQKRITDLTSPELVALLDDPFINGFVGASEIDLVKLRAYDPELNYIAESSKGIPGLPTGLPAFLQEQAVHRRGIERLKALGGLWLADKRPLYSVLIPVGDLSVRGYLEVVFNPVFNLKNIGDMIQMPFGIHGVDDREIVHPSSLAEDAPTHFPVKYPLHSNDGSLLLYLVAYDDLDKLENDLYRSQLGTTLSFFALMVAALLIVLWLLNRYLFRPVHIMLDDMEHSLRGEQAAPIDTHAIKEIHIAARAFNVMTRKVADNINELQRLSALDGLTSIANRRHFDLTLEEEWPRAAREGNAVSLILIDIDFFKQYNDHYGHQAGDQCLREIAQCLELAVQRPADLVARYGGEEFVALLPNTGSAGAIKVAQRLQQHVAILNLPHAASAVARSVTISLGVATFAPEPTHDSAMLLSAADAALYRAKHEGRNRIALAVFD